MSLTLFLRWWAYFLQVICVRYSGLYRIIFIIIYMSMPSRGWTTDTNAIIIRSFSGEVLYRDCVSHCLLCSPTSSVRLLRSTLYFTIGLLNTLIFDKCTFLYFSVCYAMFNTAVALRKKFFIPGVLLRSFFTSGISFFFRRLYHATLHIFQSSLFSL